MNNYDDEKNNLNNENYNTDKKEVADIFNENHENHENHENNGEDYPYYQYDGATIPPKSSQEIKETIRQEKLRQKQLKKSQKQNKSNFNFKKFATMTAMAVFLGVVAGFGFFVTNYLSGKIVVNKTTSFSTTDDMDKKAEHNKNIDNKITTKVAGYKVMNDVSQIVAANKPAMVNISATTKTKLQDFFRGSYYENVPVSGSGFIISEDKENYYIATNNHVIDNGDNLSVAFVDNSVAPAVVKGTDRYNDLAVISVAKDDISKDTKLKIKKVEIGDSENLVEGQSVIAMGNALGYGQSTTQGIISALDRTIETEEGIKMEHLIQTDAAINFGNSGGALIDSSGRVIGINSAKTAAVAVEGIGYAIPISKAEPIISNILKDDRKVVDEKNRGMLGIVGMTTDAQANEQYGIPIGFYIKEVNKDTGAFEAGLKKGDVIIAINGFKVVTQADIAQRLQYFKVGDKVEVTLMRQNNGEYEQLKKDVKISPKSKIILQQEERQKQYFENQNQPDTPENIRPQDEDNKNNNGNQDEMRKKLDGILEEMFGKP